MNLLSLSHILSRRRKICFQSWSLDDVLLWLQHLQLDDVASVLIGYDMRGEDLLKWDDDCLGKGSNYCFNSI